MKENDQIKTALITGCSTGIGKATAIKLAEDGHNIIAINRKCEKSDLAFEEISKFGKGDKYQYYADLSEVDSIRQVVKEIKSNHNQIDVLINNAGVFKTKEAFSKDGTELTMAVNFRAPALLTKLLIPNIESTQDPRVIFLSSELYKNAQINPEDIFHYKKYNSGKVYANSKMLINILTKFLSNNNPKTKFYSIHPGVIASEAFRDYPSLFVKILNLFLSKPEKGAKRVVNIIADDITAASGAYFFEESEKELSTYPAALEEKIEDWYVSL